MNEEPQRDPLSEAIKQLQEAYEQITTLTVENARLSDKNLELEKRVTNLLTLRNHHVLKEVK